MRRIALWMLCLALALLCAPVCAAQGEQASLRIAASADLHVNPAYRTTGIVNPLEPYHLQLVDAFMWDAKQQEADILLLLGVAEQFFCFRGLGRPGLRSDGRDGDDNENNDLY